MEGWRELGKDKHYSRVSKVRVRENVKVKVELKPKVKADISRVN
jgi:hypothetical protein